MLSDENTRKASQSAAGLFGFYTKSFLFCRAMQNCLSRRDTKKAHDVNVDTVTGAVCRYGWRLNFGYSDELPCPSSFSSYRITELTEHVQNM